MLKPIKPIFPDLVYDVSGRGEEVERGERACGGCGGAVVVSLFWFGDNLCDCYASQGEGRGWRGGFVSVQNFMSFGSILQLFFTYLFFYVFCSLLQCFK